MILHTNQVFGLKNCISVAAQKTKFSIKDFFSKCDHIRRKSRIWSHLLKKSLMENFVFCAVYLNGNSQVAHVTYTIHNRRVWATYDFPNYWDFFSFHYGLRHPFILNVCNCTFSFCLRWNIIFKFPQLFGFLQNFMKFLWVILVEH